MERAEAHLPSYAFFCWCCVHLGCKISFDVSCADDMTGKHAGIGSRHVRAIPWPSGLGLLRTPGASLRASPGRHLGVVRP